MTKPDQTSRRDFLKASTVAGIALAGGLSVQRSAYAAGSERIRVALIGCGGRGRGAAANCLGADPSIRIVALADAFEQPAQFALHELSKIGKDRVDVAKERIFVGLDAYQKAIATDVDMVILTTPPGFRPLMYAAAVAAGKHVFMEKPCCVDAPGFRSLMESNKVAEQKNLKVGVGLQRRHASNYLECIAKIRDGAIGKLQLLQSFWNGDGVWNRQRTPEMTEMQYQVNNWYHFCWLSGDNIVEQNVHNIDVCNWAMDAHPVQANGMGGCTSRYAGGNKGTGQIFDHHFVEYTYADGAKMYTQARHIPGAWSPVGEYAFGTKGESNLAGYIKAQAAAAPEGRRPRRSRTGAVSGDPYVQEHIDLVAAIRENAKYCEGWYGATSSMTGVLGRMATYSGQVVKWDEAVAKGTSDFPAQLTWDAMAPVAKNANGDYPIPVPGVFKPY
jgi:myo-inositol 2-dehydrogenase / D-chiro-inositol 1-dehydrogenase